jgi:hypothetical protein
MDKIEKIEESPDYYDPSNRLVGKINEIIDYFNQSQKQPEGEYKCGTLEVLKNPKLRKGLSQTREWNDKEGNHHIEKVDSNRVTKTVIPNQYQRQPEGESLCPYVETVGTPVLESTTTYSNTEPEKQEEWRERFRKEMEEDRDIEGCQAFTKKCGKRDKDGKFKCEYCQRWGGQQRVEQKVVLTLEKVEDFISQLLSERTFTKEELEQIKRDIEMVKYEWGLGEESEELHRKVSKLLELKEEE